MFTDSKCLLIEVLIVCFIGNTLLHIIYRLDDMKPINFLHRHCRNAIYPQSDILRFQIPDGLVNWSEKFSEYSPRFYESPIIVGKPWADPPIDDKSFTPTWNTVDGGIDRISHHGTYNIKDKVPLNPFGRTGITGRGLLGRWGPNHAADPIVTRWKRNADGAILKNSKTERNILQMVAIQRCDNSMWAIPGGMVDVNEKCTATLKREFIEEALNSGQAHGIEDFFDRNGIEIFSGYVDDPRNTDNAWIETVAFNFHDETGSILSSIKFEAGDDAKNVRWLDLDESIQLYANHKEIVKAVSDRMNSHW